LQSNLQYLRRDEVDTVKWDQCIDKAPNGLIYAFSFYLDHMAPGWSALVLDDYEAVMPLPWRRKWGIKYLYRPAFVQQLGIFSNATLTSEIENSFLTVLPHHFQFAEQFLNYAHGGDTRRPHSNFILPLQASYEQLQQNYKDDLVKNLKRAARFSLVYSAAKDYKKTLLAFAELYGHRMPHVTDADYKNWEKIFSFLDEQNRVIVRTVSENEQVLSSALLMRNKERLYLMVSVTGDKGRSTGANHFLIDRLIAEYAQSGLILDFEGSDLAGVAHFYKNFGSIDQPYSFYRFNKLPWPFRLLK